MRRSLTLFLARQAGEEPDGSEPAIGLRQHTSANKGMEGGLKRLGGTAESDFMKGGLEEER